MPSKRMTGINRAERRGDSGALSDCPLPCLFLLHPHLPFSLLHLLSSSSAPLRSELLHSFIKSPKVAPLSTSLISTNLLLKKSPFRLSTGAENMQKTLFFLRIHMFNHNNTNLNTWLHSETFPPCTSSICLFMNQHFKVTTYPCEHQCLHSTDISPCIFTSNTPWDYALQMQ